MVAGMVNRGSVAIVTGSASGIGLAIIEQAGERGYLPVGFDVAERRPDEGVASRARGRIVHVDVTHPLALRRAVDDVERDVGPVGLAVAAAGVLEEQPFDAIDEALWNRTLEVHLRGVYNLTVSVRPPMAVRGDGSIVTISSELAFLGAERHVHYVAAKAAVVGFTRAAARELGHDGIRVNCVAPGPTDTPLLGWTSPRSGSRPSPRRGLCRRSPGWDVDVRTSSPPRDVMTIGRATAAVVFLANDKEGHLRGQVIRIPSGITT